MALPRKLKYLNLFNDGLSYMGIVSSVTLPKLARKLENYRGGGMNGSAPVDFGLDDEALNVEWAIGGLPDDALWGQYAAASASTVPLRFCGSYQRDDTGDVVAVEIVLRGRHKEMDFGEQKQGEDTETKITTQCTYYKLTVDGKERIEIDTINMIERVNGVDMLERHRRNIGLS
ncbi:phage major tail tube protein [Serratia fonticola]